MCGNDIFKLPLGTFEKLVYCALSRYAGATNRAWPSYDTLATDVACGRKRVIEAVNTLVKCKLVEKQVRGNQTNVYLVYPPEYYVCAAHEKEGEKNKNGNSAPETPSGGVGVSVEHPESISGTPPGVSVGHPGVSTEHPKRNNIINKENNSLKKEAGEDELRRYSDKDRDESMEVIRREFRRKGAQVTDMVIKTFLSENSENEIKAAIKATDFNESRNPIAVIKWMLKTGSYIMPIEKEAPAPPPEVRMPEDNDEAAIKEMIRNARMGLRSKTESHLSV
jgi:hypothetical protein